MSVNFLVSIITFHILLQRYSLFSFSFSALNLFLLFVGTQHKIRSWHNGKRSVINYFLYHNHVRLWILSAHSLFGWTVYTVEAPSGEKVSFPKELSENTLAVSTSNHRWHPSNLDWNLKIYHLCRDIWKCLEYFIKAALTDWHLEQDG